MKVRFSRRSLLYAAWVITLFIVIGFVIFLALYFWPHKMKMLQNGPTAKLSYKESVTKIKSHITKDTKNKQLRAGCQPILKTHKSKPTKRKAVMMLHGVNSCPEQFKDLAKTFHKAGYNVYVPRVPEHGFKDNLHYSAITSKQLSNFLHESATIASGLGSSIGVIGVSGGANLATWLIERTDIFSRALLLSPFYEPAAQHAPKWQLPLLKTLYGRNILPDNLKDDYSFRALGKYLIVADNYHPDHQATSLKHLAVITSENDKEIDLDLAHAIPRAIKEANDISYQETRLAKELAVAHDIVGPKSVGVNQNKAQLHNLFLSFYENKKPATAL